MSRLATRFDALRASKAPGLVTYVTAGDPTPAVSADVLLAIAAAGADVLEVGVPFSDPIADGPVIQRATERALAAGGNLGVTLDIIAKVRAKIGQPIVLFTYVNPVMRMGTDAFIARAASAGVDGVLMLDLPIEESADLCARLGTQGLDQIFLISPTTSDARLAEAARLGRGFLYVISRLGVTGARDQVSGAAAPLVERIRRVTSLPIAVGFGLSKPEHLAEVAAFADAAVVGSALVTVIGEAGADAPAKAGAFVRWLRGR
ncbi:MAG: tryptophan synthase subunit alpha [Acidobacteria bacterium]|nr:MAG: tryptophan synthase subunit alpha [Acidobacteriota bacterium]